MLLSRSFLAITLLALGGTVLADLTPVMERRHKSSHGSGGADGSGGSGPPGPSKGPAANGDPGITCENIVDPQYWTIVYDPIPAGCYEEGQKIPIKWSVQDAAAAKAADGGNPNIGYSESPVVQFDFFFKQKGRWTFIPAIAPVHGDDAVPVCATKGSIELELPPVGTYKPDELWPLDRTIYGLTTFEWRKTGSGVPYTPINEQPARSKLNANTGFVIAAPGGCKGYPGGGK